MKNILYILISFLFCEISLSQTLPTKSPFGNYFLETPAGSINKITLNDDYTYQYNSDAGIFELHNDSIILNSTQRVSKTGIVMHVDTLLLINYKKIVYFHVGAGYDTTTYYEKNGRGKNIDLKNKEVKFYNKKKQLTKEGAFINFKLCDGKSYEYDSADKLKRVLFYRNGRVFRDSVVNIQ